jgi:hypothetical protein
MGERLGTLVLFVSGLALLLVGTNGLIEPRTLLAPLGILLPSPSALNEARANYGGMHVGMGLFFMTAAFRPALRVAALMVAIVFMGGLFAGRVVSTLVDGAPDPFVGLLFASELGGALFALIALRAERSRAV